jgi:hypothetical protein
MEMQQKSKSPLGKTVRKTLPLAANLMGVMPYVGGVDATLRGLASDDDAEREKAVTYGLSQIGGNALQDYLTAQFSGGAAPYINLGIDSAYNMFGDYELKKQIEDDESIVNNNPDAVNRAMWLKMYGPLLKPIAKQIIENPMYEKGMTGISKVGDVINTPVKYATPTIQALADLFTGKPQQNKMPQKKQPIKK